MKTGYRCVAVICLAALAVAARATGADTVILKNSAKPITGTVIRDDARGVALRSEGSPELARANIKEIIYDNNRPAEYALGREAAREGRHSDAARLLGEALAGSHHKLLEQYILLHLARAEERIGREDAARTAFKKLARKGNRTRFLFEALDGLVRLGAEVRAPGPDSGLTEAQLVFLRARVHEMQDRHKSALGLFKSAGRQAASGTALARRADLGVARCLVKLGKFPEAVKRLRRFVRSTDDTLHAEAYVLLGDALSAGATDSEDWNAAALAYLRVTVHHPGDPLTEVPALEGAARCFKRIPEGGAARAKKLEEHLAKTYPREAKVDS